MGALFLGCGVYTRLRAHNSWTSIFLIYAVGSGVHWGGPIGIADHALETALFFVYLAFTAMADAALLHLALIYPTYWYRSGALSFVLYAPAGIALLYSGVSPFVPQSTSKVVAALTLVLASVLSLAGGFVLLARFYFLPPAMRRASRLGVVVYIGITSTIVGLLGSSGVLPGQPDAWNLLLGALPLTITFALAANELQLPSHARGS